MHLTDFHCHPLERKRTFEGMREFALAARERGLAGLVFTEHAPLLPGGLTWDELPLYIEYTHRIQEEFAPYPIHLGIELDFRTDLQEDARRVLEHADFAYVIGSVHLHTSLHRAALEGLDFGEAVRYGLKLTRQAARTGLFHAISHLDFFRYLCHLPAFSTWRGGYVPQNYEGEFRETFATMQDTGTILEINASGLRKVFAALLPCPEILNWADDYDLRYAIGSDAHDAHFVGEDFATVLAALTDDQVSRIAPTV